MDDVKDTIVELRDTLKQAIQSKHPHKETIDWDSRKTWWLGKLDNLYADIKTWCTSAEIETEEFETTLNENYIGVYKAKKLVLKTGSEPFIFVPIGRNIIGGRGRVDILFNNSKTSLILFAKGERPEIKITFFSSLEKTEDKKTTYNPEPTETEWCFSDAARDSYQILTEESFLTFLKKKMSA